MFKLQFYTSDAMSKFLWEIINCYRELTINSKNELINTFRLSHIIPSIYIKLFNRAGKARCNQYFWNMRADLLSFAKRHAE